jgi:hypothetical protein
MSSSDNYEYEKLGFLPNPDMSLRLVTYLSPSVCLTTVAIVVNTDVPWPIIVQSSNPFWNSCRHHPSSLLWHNTSARFPVPSSHNSSGILASVRLIWGRTSPFLLVLTSSSGLRLLTHRLSTHMLGTLGLFAYCTLSHSPFRSLCLFGRYHNSLPPPPFFTSCSWKKKSFSCFLRVFFPSFLVREDPILLSSVDVYCCTYREDVGNTFPLCES